MLKFRWNTARIDDENIIIVGFITLYENNPYEMKTWISLNVKSIRTLCSCLTESNVFRQSMPSPVSTPWDTITFRYSASMMEKDISIFCDHKQKDGKIEENILTIPIDTFGERKKNMTYIAPLVEELKQYIPK